MIQSELNDNLYKSSQNDYTQGVKDALLNGADVNYLESAAIINAVFNQNIAMVQLLIDYKINIHIEDSNALMIAVKNNLVEITQILLEANINIYAQKDEAFKLAINNDNVEIYQLLIQYSAYPESDILRMENKISENSNIKQWIKTYLEKKMLKENLQQHLEVRESIYNKI